MSCSSLFQLHYNRKNNQQTAAVIRVHAISCATFAIVNTASICAIGCVTANLNDEEANDENEQENKKTLPNQTQNYFYFESLFNKFSMVTHTEADNNVMSGQIEVPQHLPQVFHLFHNIS